MCKFKKVNKKANMRKVVPKQCKQNQKSPLDPNPPLDNFAPIGQVPFEIFKNHNLKIKSVKI